MGQNSAGYHIKGKKKGGRPLVQQHRGGEIKGRKKRRCSFEGPKFGQKGEECG